MNYFDDDGKWKVIYHPSVEPTPYHVARIKRKNEPLHGGNIEEADCGYFAERAAAQAMADEMNSRDGESNGDI